MKLRITSDIHTEFMGHGENIPSWLTTAVLPPMANDQSTTLIIAGDLGSMHKPANLVTALECLSPRFESIIYTPGNHEYYGGSIAMTAHFIREKTCHIPNLCFGEQMLLIDKTPPDIHACTLWTDFDGLNPRSMDNARRRMNDYRLCGLTQNDLLQPEHTAEIHRLTLVELKRDVKKGDIVITHHLPSFKSIDPEYTASDVNGAYATNLEDFILEAEPALWIHGHTHASNDYMIGKTRVISNPRGYEGQVNPTYNNKLLVEYENTGVDQAGT